MVGVLLGVVGLGFLGLLLVVAINAAVSEDRARASQRSMERMIQQSVRIELETKLAAEACSDRFLRDVQAYLEHRRPRS